MADYQDLIVFLREMADELEKDAKHEKAEKSFEQRTLA
jgi:hypothetical protein